jgi:hypothetical protein
MSHDDSSGLVCSYCGTRKQGVRKLGGISLCEVCAACAFCGKPHRQVWKLVAGPKVLICNECVALCNDIFDEEAASAGRALAGTPSSTVSVLDWKATRLAGQARRLAEACDRAVELPRPAAERARALAEELERFASPGDGSRAVFTQYANVVAATARSFATTCDTLELPGPLLQRARALADEIEALVRAKDDR